MEDWFEFIKTLKAMSLEAFLEEEWGSEEDWNSLHGSPEGRIVIRVIRGGNEYMQVGDSRSGETPTLAVGFPVVVRFPNGFYKSTAVRSIDWESGTFKTMCSTYGFHFCPD